MHIKSNLGRIIMSLCYYCAINSTLWKLSVMLYINQMKICYKHLQENTTHP